MFKSRLLSHPFDNYCIRPGVTDPKLHFVLPLFLPHVTSGNLTLDRLLYIAMRHKRNNQSLLEVLEYVHEHTLHTLPQIFVFFDRSGIRRPKPIIRIYVLGVEGSKFLLDPLLLMPLVLFSPIDRLAKVFKDYDWN